MARTEEDLRKAKDRAASYRLMVESWAFKDFQAYLDELRTQTVNDFISFDEHESVEFKVGQYKGMLDCLTRIKRELEFILNP